MSADAPTRDEPTHESPHDVGQADAERGAATVASHLRMRALGVQDWRVLRAFELVPRAPFVAPRHESLAARDVALPIGCGQTTAEPGLIARMIEALGVERGHRVLEIGAGSGYATAILAQLAGTILGLERFRGLAVAAQGRLDAWGVGNAAVVWADGFATTGLSAAAERGAFDRIIVHGVLDAVPGWLTARLTEGAVLVCARRTTRGQDVVRLSGPGLCDEHPVCACRLQPMRQGLAGTLPTLGRAGPRPT